MIELFLKLLIGHFIADCVGAKVTAVRIRQDGRVLCAAMHTAEDGDVYVDDSLHYYLSVEAKVLVTQPHEQHMKRGEWWWVNAIPADIKVEEFYLTE